MRYVIFGAGAVGGVIGGRLCVAGVEVVLVARGPHLDALRARGLALIAPDGEEQIDVAAVGSLEEARLRPGEVVVLAVKSHQTADAVDALSDWAPPETVVVCAQNGVANESMALRVLPEVYGMYTWLPAVLASPGVVVQHASPLAGALHLGRFPTGSDDRAEVIATDLRRAGFASEVYPEIMRLKYRKLVANLGNVLDALTGEWVESSILDRARAEAEECFRAAGTEVQTVEEDAAMGNPEVREVPGHPWGGSSSRQSLARNTGAIETDYLNGEIVLLGRLHGVPTPVNECLQRLSHRAVREGWGPRAMTLDEIEDQVDEASRRSTSTRGPRSQN